MKKLFSVIIILSFSSGIPAKNSISSQFKPENYSKAVIYYEPYWASTRSPRSVAIIKQYPKVKIELSQYSDQIAGLFSHLHFDSLVPYVGKKEFSAVNLIVELYDLKGNLAHTFYSSNCCCLYSYRKDNSICLFTTDFSYMTRVKYPDIYHKFEFYNPLIELEKEMKK